tara:strand:- start:352 stop:1320 length:969 start_codon:yes stop_codon:yes gene_type:complete
MTQNDNIQTDTPAVESKEPTYTSLEEAVFGDSSPEAGSDTISDIFNNTGNEGNVEQAPEQGQPPVNESTNTEQPLSGIDDNDTKRYQYWQSQADKYKNELEQVRINQPPQEAVPTQPAPVQPVQPEAQEFPAAPERPGRPRNFSREEAYTDPSSESARYLDAKEDWDEQMVEYNALHTQYQNAMLQDKFDSMQRERVEETQRQQAAQAASKQQADIVNYVTGHHGMNDNQAQDFLTKMSDPASINIDNLVQLYRMQEGSAVPQQNNAPAQPSQAFTQTKNAQQVPSSMGVMPSGQSNADGRSMEDKMIDTMIGSFNEKNPWK